MSGVAPSEFILICLIALMILGPERLPKLARQLGGWMGKARQMTRSIKRQLEEETDLKKNFGFDPKELDPNEMLKPRDDDTFSPLHEDEDEDEDEDESVEDQDVEDDATEKTDK
jgi:sec-independent protein translocase protein TatB